MSVSYFIPDLAPEAMHRCEEIIRRSRRLMLLPSKAEVSFSYLF